MLGRLRGCVGGRFGLTMSLTDRDVPISAGAELGPGGVRGQEAAPSPRGPQARMTWGLGLDPWARPDPIWRPADFGAATFVD
jgi:hypothetical protein